MNKQSLNRTVKRQKPPTKSKYLNQKIEADGYKFDSKAEYRYYLRLKQKLAAGEIQSFEMQQPIVLIDGFRKSGKKYQAMVYKADFVITHNDGEVVVVDVKGQPKVTADFAMKFKLFHARYPNRFIIARYNYKTGQFKETETLR